jgi:hypothetical protein
LLQYGDVGVGVFPEGKEVFVGGERPDEQHKENDGGSSYVCAVPGNGIRRTSHQQEKEMTVTVEEDGNCLQGISVSDASWDGRQLCTDYPYGAAGYFRRCVGSTVEIEAKWTFSGDPKTTAPVAISKVFKVGRKKVYDPCALSKKGYGGMAMVAGGADPGATAEMLTRNCSEATAAAVADNSDDDDQC